MNETTKRYGVHAGEPMSERPPQPLLAAEHADEKHVTYCKNCRTGCLHWYRTKTAGWRLFDKEGRIHSCK